MDQPFSHPSHASHYRMAMLLVIIIAGWFALYNLIEPFANWVSYSLLRLQAGSHLGESVAFFYIMSPRFCCYSRA